VAQQALMRAIEALSTYDAYPGSSFEAWIYRITHNHLLNELRRPGRRVEPVDPGDIVELYDRADLPRHDLKWLTDADLDDAYDELSRREQAVLKLRFAGGFEHREIAELLGIRPATVRQIQRRALEALRRSIAPARRDERRVSAGDA
jgi:RNA polymerase sigma factor (sigma-70 family)